MSAHVGRDRSGSSSSTERRKDSGEMSGNKGRDLKFLIKVEKNMPWRRNVILRNFLR